MSGVILKDVAAAVQRAVEAARERPDEEVAMIVNEVIADLGVPPTQVQFAKRAEDLLEASVRRLDEMGDHPQAPLIGTLGGIGFALLAGVENTEALFAMLAGVESESQGG